ncbi:MAG: YkgJ family cysteine cluster protein [Candidatus Anstonellaceae archaeon]
MEAKISPKITNECRFCSAKCCMGLAVVLTIPEAKRMAKSLGLEPEDFLEFSCNINSKETPHYPLLVKHGGKIYEYFLILKRRNKKECIFLQQDMSCKIYQHRPAVCRLYPFELDGKAVKKGALCPVKFQPTQEISEAAAQLQEDLLEHGKLARRWTVKFGKEAPDIKRFDQYFQL